MNAVLIKNPVVREVETVTTTLTVLEIWSVAWREAVRNITLMLNPIHPAARKRAVLEAKTKTAVVLNHSLAVWEGETVTTTTNVLGTTWSVARLATVKGGTQMLFSIVTAARKGKKDPQQHHDQQEHQPSCHQRHHHQLTEQQKIVLQKLAKYKMYVVNITHPVVWEVETVTRTIIVHRAWSVACLVTARSCSTQMLTPKVNAARRSKTTVTELEKVKVWLTSTNRHVVQLISPAVLEVATVAVTNNVMGTWSVAMFMQSMGIGGTVGQSSTTLWRPSTVHAARKGNVMEPLAKTPVVLKTGLVIWEKETVTV